MRILFLSHYFPPEGNAPATRTFENCKRWVQAGHHVTVVTCVPNSPNGVVYEGYRNRLFQREEMEGIEVIRVWSYVAANKGTFRRFLNYVSFAISAVVASAVMRRPDLIVATSPQFFCGLAGAVGSYMRRLPWVLEIRDIWPDSIAAVGASVPSLVLSALTVLERWMYRAADHIVTVGEGYKRELVSKNVPSTKITIVTNGVDPEEYLPRGSDEECKRRLGVTRPFVCSYVGTVGMACGLRVVLESARMLKLRGRHDIAFLVVGDGAIRAELQQEVAAEGLDNVVFTGRMPKQIVPAVLSFTDVSLVHLRKADLFKTVLPSKIFESAAMARPIILGVEGESAELLRLADAGVCIEPENAQQLTDSLIHLADHPAERRRLGQNGREFVLTHFDRRVLADAYLALLLRVAAQQETVMA